jgi:hypothetical protein
VNPNLGHRPQPNPTQAKTVDGGAQTHLAGARVGVTFLVAAELDASDPHAVEVVGVETHDKACTADVRRSEEQLENELDDLKRDFHGERRHCPIRSRPAGHPTRAVFIAAKSPDSANSTTARVDKVVTESSGRAREI